MSRRKRIHGHKRTHRSPLPKVEGNRTLDTSSGVDPTDVQDFFKSKAKKDLTKKAVTRTIGAVAGNVAGGIGLAATLYDSGAQFIPDPKSEVTKGEHTESIWANKKSIF